MQPRHIVIVAFPGLQSLDVTGPFEAFSIAARLLGARKRRGYELHLVSRGGLPVKSESGLSIGTTELPGVAGEPPVRCDTLMLPGGTGVHAAARDEHLVDWVRSTGRAARRMTTVCSGAFLGAAAGQLDGKRVTTHWARAARLADEHPQLRVDADPIYVRDGKVWTSAGVTAGIDLALALIAADHGESLAQEVARWLVMYLHRPGGQTQFAAPVWTPRAEHSMVRACQSRIEAEPGGDHRVSTLACDAAMSERHFARVFTEEVGESPGRYVERVRAEAARHDLEQTTDTLDVIARRCGFGTAETLRRVFHRRLGVAPDSYRRRFRVA